MTPRDLITRLESEGVTATLKLRLEGDSAPSPETIALLQTHRDDLITHLALKQGDTPQTVRVDIAPNILTNLMVWVAQYHELRLELPNQLVLHAAPETVLDAVKHEPWGVVYRADRGVVLVWGQPPKDKLSDYRHLETGEPLIRTVN